MSGQVIFQSKLLAFLLLIAGMVAAAPVLFAQEVEYTQEEYNLYSEAVGKPDLKARQQAIIDFIKANPESALNQYAVDRYIQAMQEQQQNKEHAVVVEMGEKFLSSVNDSHPGVLHLTTRSAFQIQQYENTVQYGLKLEKEAPEKVPGLNYILAKSFQAANNEAQFISYGEKACSELSPKDCLDLLPSLMRGFAGKKDWKKAAFYAEKTIEALDATPRPAHLDQQEWGNFTKEERASAYSLLGKHAAQNKKWNAAEQYYRQAIQTKPTPARSVEAYYYIGMANWNKGAIDPAMEAFAKCSVQKDSPIADSCRKKLEQLYRSTHNDSLAGLDELIKRVTQ